jgi:hypothetical protein
MHTLHTRPRVQRAPGIPCTLHFLGSGQVHAQASGAMRRENAKLYLRRMGRAKRNPSPVRTGLDGYRFAPPILRTALKDKVHANLGLSVSREIQNSARHCERSEAIHSFFVPRGGLLRFARNNADKRGVPDTPASVAYDAPLEPRKILQPAARSRFRSRPCERPFPFQIDND